jgi:hypothetical protein
MTKVLNARLVAQLRKVINEKSSYPLGILVYFGPDNATITKIVAVVILSKGSSPISKNWSSSWVTSDPKVAAEIGQFFVDNKVSDVVMTDGVLGCPHDEGVDFPVGGQCSQCKYWENQPG